jgi:hypothetical protein
VFLTCDVHVLRGSLFITSGAQSLTTQRVTGRGLVVVGFDEHRSVVVCASQHYGDFAVTLVPPDAFPISLDLEFDGTAR